MAVHIFETVIIYGILKSYPFELNVELRLDGYFHVH